MSAQGRPGPDEGIEATIARLLTVGTYFAVGIVVAGVALMLVAGIDPFAAPAVGFAPATLLGDLLALRPSAVIFAGVLALIALPVARVALEAVSYLRTGDRLFAGLAGGILVVVLGSVVVALLAEV